MMESVNAQRTASIGDGVIGHGWSAARAVRVVLGDWDAAHEIGGVRLGRAGRRLRFQIATNDSDLRASGRSRRQNY